MKRSKYAKFLEQVALKHNTTVNEVRREIDIAIADAMTSTDPKAMEFWKQFGSRQPSAEEVIEIMSKEAQNRLNPLTNLKL